MDKYSDEVAIMFTDVVGYTAMMGKDEAQTIEIVNQLRTIQKDIIQRHSGVTVKELGDGVLAYFDNTIESIQSAIEIQQVVSKAFEAKIRVGIHKAEVVFSEGDIFGDGVNIAARIEPLADPGGIYLSEAVLQDLVNEEGILTKALGSVNLKNVNKPVVIYAIQAPGLPEPSIKRFNQLANPKKKLALIPTLITFLILIAVAFYIVNNFNRKRQVAEAEASLKVVESLIEKNWRDFSKAYYLAKEVEKVIPENELLKDYIKRSSVRINITSEPAGANVLVKLYSRPESEWINLGVTPLDSIEMPIGALRWKMFKQGYDTVNAAALTTKFGNIRTRSPLLVGQDFHRNLDLKDLLPQGMVRVEGASFPYGDLPEFFIDQYEVTNQEYADFINQGGYDNKRYWTDLIDMMSVSDRWEEVVSTFTDSTGIRGPSTWRNGSYPATQSNFPVSGISWYEAAAYAQFAGKELPTKDHWAMAQGINKWIVKAYQLGGNAIFAPFSNFHDQHPVAVGSLNGITSFGVHDMGGNVREWCWNESNLGRFVRGGAWNDNPYMFKVPSQADPLDRSQYNGFRCAYYPSRDKIPKVAFDWMQESTPFHNQPLPEPVAEEEFARYRDFYGYDYKDLAAIVESTSHNEKGWTLEKITLNAAYDNERFTAYLFLPDNAEPPYQTVIYGPGSGVFFQESSQDIENYFEFPAFLRFYLKSGRAVLFPVVKESFERGSEHSIEILFSKERLFTDFITRVVKDYRICLDYLETREEIDTNRLAFYGMSYGPTIGFHLTAVEPRIQVNIFYAGGLMAVGRPEANAAHFAPRVIIPTLMINGRYDSNFKIDYEIKNMYELLGTPDKHKRLVLFDSDHLAPREDLVRETLLWLDQYFGQVTLKDAPRLLGSSR